MKLINLIFALIFFVLGLMISGCSKDTENLITNSTSGQIAIIWVDYCA